VSRPAAFSFKVRINEVSGFEVSSIEVDSFKVDSFEVSSIGINSIEVSGFEVSGFEVSNSEVNRFWVSSIEVISFKVSNDDVNSFEVSSFEVSSIRVSSKEVSSIEVDGFEDIGFEVNRSFCLCTVFVFGGSAVIGSLFRVPPPLSSRTANVNGEAAPSRRDTCFADINDSRLCPTDGPCGRVEARPQGPAASALRNVLRSLLLTSPKSPPIRHQRDSQDL
jgi:hypothetical protein